ncbi:MAG: ribonuclease P protein component [Candidatus Nealsonbacteria bacterium]|nr:ribonuclease P protein component [Candidatus Nealsonbacteria bacterium]
MLSKINRLKKTAEIERVFKRGRGVREDFLFLKAAENNLRVIRFAFVVSKKISGKASSRNKIKRILRAAARRRLPRLKTGLDVVIVVHGGIENKNFQEIEQSVDKLFKKAKLT